MKKEDGGNWHRFAVMSRIRARISENFADGLSPTLLHRHLSDRGGGAAATISAPLWAAGGYLKPYFWDHKAGPSRIIRKGGIRAATDQDCPMIYDLPIQKYLSFIHWSYFGSRGDIRNSLWVWDQVRGG